MTINTTLINSGNGGIKNPKQGNGFASNTVNQAVVSKSKKKSKK